MAYWLFKSEPDVWSWDQQVSKGAEGEEWNGVRNYQARNNMRQMALGDLGFFYHSRSDLEIVGIVEVCATSHPDSTTDDPSWDCVDVRAIEALPKPVTLKQIKMTKELEEMILVKNSRLSVQPVLEAEWKLICEMSGKR